MNFIMDSVGKLIGPLMLGSELSWAVEDVQAKGYTKGEAEKIVSRIYGLSPKTIRRYRSIYEESVVQFANTQWYKTKIRVNGRDLISQVGHKPVQADPYIQRVRPATPSKRRKKRG